MVTTLNLLACFNHIEKTEPITSGLSSDSYKVYADNKAFFAKRISNPFEAIASKQGASINISPTVIYHDDDWLVTEFIDAKNLSSMPVHLDKKISLSINLMTNYHQTKIKTTKLVPKNVIDEIINNISFPSNYRHELLQIAESILEPLPNISNVVSCHGDLNFSNVLVDQQNKAWLVDYECVNNAPAEYDLAMFVAINNIEINKITMILEQYNNYSPYYIDSSILEHYLNFSYFINALWYIQAYQKTNLVQFNFLAKQQWQKLQLNRNSHLILANLI